MIAVDYDDTKNHKLFNAIFLTFLIVLIKQV